tara:strand:+ start:2249 stop:3115 length:867 start_codon:yes stop_codon:yes gene_type:complete
MNYILISLGKFPDYVKYTINSIKSVDKNATIYVCSDVYSGNFKDTNFINLNEIQNKKIQTIKNLNLYQNTIFESNPLWESSLLRIFYLESIISEVGINQSVHFDNDVLIYKSYDQVKDVFSDKEFNITRATNKRFVFGYSFISSLKSLSAITDNIIKFSKYGISHNWSFNYQKPYNEMDFLGKVYSDNKSLFNCLPIFPYDADTIFDPSSYGQFLDGTHMHPKKLVRGRYININHFIGAEIIAKRIKVKFTDNCPKVIWKKKSYEIANLHIHSKRLEKFLPKEYKDYF